MEKIAIIGGGIIGMTLANYLDTTKFEITLFDDATGQATKASAGIISPWLSKRRNKQWYQLAKDGAAFFDKLIQDFHLDSTIYDRSGTLLLRPQEELISLAELAEERKKEAPEIGNIELLTPTQTAAKLQLLKPAPSLHISGGGKLDGKAYLKQLAKRLTHQQVAIINDRVTFQPKGDAWLIQGDFGEKLVDRIILTPGPALKPLLETVGYTVDIRPQKGQLLVFDSPYQNSSEWPVAMLDGEADFIPFMSGKILIGATHENDGGWDLAPTKTAYEMLTTHTKQFLAKPEQLNDWHYHFRVGTRAYTSDFSPFFGSIPDDPTLLVASGLGSSGLTTGPYIGYLLANYLNTGNWQKKNYQKEMKTYISKSVS